MKRFFSFFVVLLLFFSVIPPAHAADQSRSYLFDLTVNGGNEVYVDTGDIITLTLRLKRTDSTTPALMYAMQDEINYDNTFFELVEGGSIASHGIETNDLALRDHFRAFYMNFVDMGGGQEWQADTMIGTFQLRIIGKTGSSVIENKNYLVSTQDGADGYSVAANDVTVILTSDCTIHFETNGGSKILDQIVEAGRKVERPKDPTKKGYRFIGWYQDMDLQTPWDFDSDIVRGNMSLYAKWEEGEASACRLWVLLILILLLLAICVFRRIYKRKKK